MELTVNQTDLHKALAIVTRAISTNRLIPVLSNVHLEVNEQGLRLAATNLELGLQTTIPMSNYTNGGSITFPAKLASDVIARLPSGSEVKLTCNTEDFSTRVQCGRTRTTLRGIDPLTFPGIPAPEGEPVVILDGTLLRDGINLVACAAAKDSIRPVLAGIAFQLADGTLSLAAADGYRIAAYSLPVEDATLDVIIPAASLRELARLLTDTNADQRAVRVYTTASQLIFDFGDEQQPTRLVSRLLAGQFPSYQQFILTESRHLASVSRVQLTDAVRLAHLFAPEDGHLLRISYGEDRLGIDTAAADRGEHAGEIDAEITGDPIVIGVNSQYLSDVLGVLHTDKVQIGCNTHLAPIMVQSDELPGYVYTCGAIVLKGEIGSDQAA